MNDFLSDFGPLHFEWTGLKFPQLNRVTMIGPTGIEAKVTLYKASTPIAIMECLAQRPNEFVSKEDLVDYCFSFQTNPTVLKFRILALRSRLTSAMRAVDIPCDDSDSLIVSNCTGWKLVETPQPKTLRTTPTAKNPKARNDVWLSPEVQEFARNLYMEKGRSVVARIVSKEFGVTVTSNMVAGKAYKEQWKKSTAPSVPSTSPNRPGARALHAQTRALPARKIAAE